MIARRLAAGPWLPTVGGRLVVASSVSNCIGIVDIITVLLMNSTPEPVECYTIDAAQCDRLCD